MAKKTTRVTHTFDGLPYEVFEALGPLVDPQKANQQKLIERFLDSWHRSTHARFNDDEDPQDRDLAESRLIAYAKLWAAMQVPTDAETQHG